MAELLFKIGRASARRAKTVLGAWLALLVLAGVGFAVGGGTLSTAITIPGTPTEQVTDRMLEEFPDAAAGTGTVVLQTSDGEPFTDEQKAQITERLADLEDVDESVIGGVDPFAAEAQREQQQQQLSDNLAQLDLAAQAPDADQEALATQRAQLEAGQEMLDMAAGYRTISEDGTTALVTVQMSTDMYSTPEGVKDAVMDVFTDEPLDGLEVYFSSDIASAIPQIFGTSEALGLVVAAVVLVIMLGTLIGAGLPLVASLVSVGVGALASLAMSGVVEMISVTPVLGLMLGLAVGIDYSLFIVNRHRRQLKEGYDVQESVALANGTSGNAVVFAGTTVLIALLALNVTGIPFLGLMGTVGAFCILVAVLVAVTLTPALLSLLGERVLSRKERAARADEPASAPKVNGVKEMSTWRAALRVLVGVVGLLVIAIPALSLRTGLPDGSQEETDTTQYQAFKIIDDKFGPGQNSPLVVVADLDDGLSEEQAQAAQMTIASDLFAVSDVTAVVPVGISEDNAAATFQVVPAGGPTDESTEDLVHALRDSEPEGATSVGVAGQASGNIDISEKLASALPIYLAVVVGLSLIIMMVVFRSIFVPIIATAGFVLSYFGALGAVVAIYQWGWLDGLFGVHDPGPILNFLPTILVGILFGLAMDYMLFIGSGVREAYAHGAPARKSVVLGVRAGRSVVVAAAIIMTSVFGGFVFSQSAMIRPIGFALAIGVLLDAFVVRLWIIPAALHLAGDGAWWLPRWLAKVLPDVDVEGAKLERRHPHVSHEEPVEDSAEVGEVSAGS